MGDIARCSIEREDLLYKLFGVNAELLIDHAWGWEPVTMDMIKAYRPETSSVSSGQVLQSPYTAAKARNVVLEMADSLSLDLVDKKLVTDQLVLTVGYDTESLTDRNIREKYQGKVATDRYGRQVPVHAHGTVNMERPTSSETILMEKAGGLFDRIINPDLLVRRITLSANHLMRESDIQPNNKAVQLDLFTDYEKLEKEQKAEEEMLAKERRRQEAVLQIKKKFGKNAILKGLNYADGATQSALTGHDEAIAETARQTAPKRILSSDEQEILSKRLAYAISHIGERPNLTFTYFIPDMLKDGGKYVKITGVILKYDELGRTVILETNEILLIDNILSISGGIIEKLQQE